MYLINGTYFQRDLTIPNTTEADSKAMLVLEQFIDEKCRLLMRDLLGVTLYNELNSYLVNGMLPAVPEFPTIDPVPLKWRNLVTGCEYSVNDVNYKWMGLYWSEGTAKGSLLADFTYYYWLLNELSFMSGVGEVRAEAKGAENVNSTQRLVNVWNRFVERYQGVCNGYHSVYSYWFGGNVYGNHQDDTVTLLQFIADNSEDYPNTDNRRYNVKNQLGL